MELGTTTLSNAYNLGTLRSIKSGDTENSLGGIIGDVRDFYFQGNDNLEIKNVYTMGNLYVDSGNIGSIIGKNDYASRVTKTNTYYIKPDVYKRQAVGSRKLRKAPAQHGPPAVAAV